MCRTGGRRCPGHHGPAAREAHNRRRRENRAIKAALIEWARREGVEPDEIRQLEAAGPKAVKDWAAARGLDPKKFLPASPDGDERPVADAPPAGGAPLAEPLPTAIRDAVPSELGRVLAAVAGKAPAAPPRPPEPAVPGRSPETWAREAWATPQLAGQIRAALAGQGDHRDERSLLQGEPDRQRQARGGTNETTRYELGNGMVGYHKPFNGLRDDIAEMFGQDEAEQPLHEVAAWRLAKRMGPPYDELVPPCVLRPVNGTLGSFAVERPGRPGRNDVSEIPEWKSAAFFDALVGQQDRHQMNYLSAGDRLTLIDHGYAFGTPGDYCNFSMLQRKRSENREAAKLTGDEMATLGRLVGSDDLFGLKGVLSGDRADAVRDRARRMLETGRILGPGDY